MASAGKLFTLLLVVAAAVTVAQGKLLARLRSGTECSQQSQSGYFRHVEDCRRFYFCPDKVLSESITPLEEREAYARITATGLTCPDEESIFDESDLQCRHISLVKSVPPECLITSSTIRQSTQSTDEAENQVSNN